jgi:CDP-glucose 4,6-dehydratase
MMRYEPLKCAGGTAEAVRGTGAMRFWAGRRVLVTGCTGFLGWGMTEALVARGARTLGLVRDDEPRSQFNVLGLAEKVDVVRGNVEDYQTIERALNEYEIDTVFHLAAQAIVGVANRNPMSTFESNIKGTWVVLEACRRNRQVSRIVVASSDKAYGLHDTLPYQEDFPLRGEHPYDVSKSCADLIALSYHHTYATPVCVTRCGNLFGPGDLNFSRIVPGTIRSVLTNARPVIRSDGSPVRDYVFVRDIVSAYLMLAERMDDPALHGQAFNLGTGEPVAVLDLTHRILRLAGRPDLEPIVQNVSCGEIQAQYLSSVRANQALGWSPAAPLDQRLSETIAWYRANRAGF